MKTILVLAWDAEDMAAFEVAADLARRFGAHVVGLGPPSYRAVSVAWTDVGMGAPFDTPLADDEEERRRMAGLRASFLRAMDTAGIPDVATASAVAPRKRELVPLIAARAPRRPPDAPLR